MREYVTDDKGSWGPGPWRDEIDKAQWVDELTGLDCLIVRNRMGGLCGYVGVPESHPLHGVEYSQESPALAAALARRMAEPVGEAPSFAVLLGVLGGGLEPRPDVVFNVHGGITFSGPCDEPTEREWLQVETKASDPGLLRRAAEHPDGDAAQHLARLREQVGMTFSDWLSYQWARRICHVPEAGRPGRVWWYGFDCGHSGDLLPGMAAMLGKLTGRERPSWEVYRDRPYVAAECARLARQLAAVDGRPAPRRVLRPEG